MSGLSCALALLYAYLPDPTGLEDQIRQSTRGALDAGDVQYPLLPACGSRPTPCGTTLAVVFVGCRVTLVPAAASSLRWVFVQRVRSCG